MIMKKFLKKLKGENKKSTKDIDAGHEKIEQLTFDQIVKDTQIMIEETIDGLHKLMEINQRLLENSREMTVLCDKFLADDRLNKVDIENAVDYVSLEVMVKVTDEALKKMNEIGTINQKGGITNV